jgi:hypothetical protein
MSAYLHDDVTWREWILSFAKVNYRSSDSYQVPKLCDPVSSAKKPGKMDRVNI